MLKFPGLTIIVIIALLVVPTLAGSQPACLPKSIFAKNEAGDLPVLKLGYINNVLTLCAYERGADADKLLGCWTVNPTTGALGSSAATAIPGLARRIALDPKNCFDGYCVPEIAQSSDASISFAASTDGLHAAIMNQKFLYIFTTNTKEKVAEIELSRPGTSDFSNDVSNMPWDLVYNNDTLFVTGSDAGPFIGVWVFKANGSRAGAVTAPAGGADSRLNIYRGGYGILGSDRVAFADAGLQNMIFVMGANTAKKTTKRSVSHAPCTAAQFEEWAIGDDSGIGAACKRVLAAKYAPYIDMSLAQLPSSDIIATLNGPAQGTIAVLNPAGLTERRRLNLAKCR